ncbi:glycosyltransferase [Alphaproteobacteria bacterium]|nr:glycosyltransferase [Alphaproteobacteria bacterium]
MKKLLIIGGTSAKQLHDKSVRIKYPFKLYIEELANYFDNVTWIVSNKIHSPVNSSVEMNNINIIPHNNTLISSFATILLILKILKNKDYYVLLFPSPKIQIIIPWIAKKAIKSCYYIGVNPDKFQINFFKGLLGWRKFLVFIHKVPFNYADHIIARGQYLAELALKRNTNVTQTIPISYQLNYNKLKFNKESNKIIFVGKMLKNKGIFDLYETVKTINEKKCLPEELKIDFVGDGADLIKLKNLIKKEKSKSVNLSGWIDDQKLMINKLGRSTLLVCPSLSKYPEGVPRVIDESLSCNTPVLCSDHQSIINYTHKDMILFFKTDDIHDLEKKILCFFQNNSLRKNLFKTINTHNINKKRLSAAKQHAQILLDNPIIKRNDSKNKYQKNKFINENTSEKLINSLSSTRTLIYCINRVIELIYRFVHFKEPWLTPSAIKKLKKLIKNDFVGFEFGSGRSTLWFAKRCASISSIETSLIWKNKILNSAKKESLNNINIHLVDQLSEDFENYYLAEIQSIRDESLDFVLVDGKIRDLSTLKSIPKIKPGGMIIIDNFQRYLPSNSIAPFAIGIKEQPLNKTWSKIYKLYLSKWKSISTSNGVNDTVIFFKP